MSAFPLLLIALLMFGSILVFETVNDPSQPRIRPLGLLGWLAAGNWPAKVGAGLLIFGVGALLRYAMLHIDVPPEIKLGGGIVLSGVLGACALALKNRPARRAIELALAGAAFGVAYLTAYSAYGFFNYISDVNALALLALVAVAAGVYAIGRQAVSVAVLAMAGAYIAPRFAIGSPGPLSVYGYYLAASSLTLLMVTLRGWRPLIHLSFLFTLAGALFFGWSGRFYEAQYYPVMQPLLLELAAVHLAMPLFERKHAATGWAARFDTGYFVLLPLVAAGLTLKIAPALDEQGALGLGALALLWGAAAALLGVFGQPGARRHAALAVLLALGAVLCWMPDIPWALVRLGVVVVLLAVAGLLGWPSAIEELLAGTVLTFGALHVVASIVHPAPAAAFLNAVFAERLVASALLLFAGAIAKRRRLSMTQVLFAGGAGWAALALLAELLRLQIDFLPQLVYGLVLALALCAAAAGRRGPLRGAWGAMLLLVLFACGWWAAADAGIACALAYLALTPCVLLALAWAGREGSAKGAGEHAAATALAMLPFALLPWLRSVAGLAGLEEAYFEAAVATAGAIAAALAGRVWLPSSARWHGHFKALHFALVALAVLYASVFHIERGPWPVAFDMCALTYLMLLWVGQADARVPFRFAPGAAVVAAFALVLQAMVLRVFGPPGVMTAADIDRIALPAVLSLMWAVFGATLAWWGARGKSRHHWSAGAVLLAVAACKLVFFDFASFGQLGNIVALIAAGLVFMAVAWFAPMPPAQADAAAKGKGGSGAAIWIGALVAAFLLSMIVLVVHRHAQHIDALRKLAQEVTAVDADAASAP
jgi:uncharacterized membrane protein